jgi:stage II sporulation protein B
MDKPKVSIKINGRERSFYEATSDNNVKQKVNIPAKEMPPQAEEKSTESFVDIDEILAKEEVAAGNEEREFDWILPQHDHQDDKVKIDSIVNIDELRKKKNPMFGTISFGSHLKKRKNEVYPLKTLLLSIVSALVVGTCFGMIVLRLFTGETIPVAVPSNPSNQQTEKQGASEKGTGAESTDQSAIKEPFTLPGLNAFVVQGGVFSSEEAAGPIVEEIKDKGFAGTTVAIDEKYYLFMGLGLTKDAGAAIRTPYDEQGQDTYVKAITTPELNVNGDPAVLKARQLFDQLVAYSTNIYLSLPQEAKWEDIKSASEQIKLSDQDAKSTTTAFVTSVKEAYTKVNAYQATSATKDFWASQQALLTSYQVYQKWILENKKQ